MGVYISAGSLISPQNTHDVTDFPERINSVVSDRLTCIEPDYRTLINPVMLRRMPRVIKMGLASAQLCIQRSGYVNPDGIIVGTGLGCLDNLEKFLMDMINNNEHVSSVLPFINSTHNAVAAQISMMLKNQKYNVTYCHRNFSFETALLDAIMMIGEDTSQNILIGGIDECTPDFILLHSYLNAWKKPVNNLSLLTEKTTGTIAGEGSGFFMLSGIPGGEQGCVSIEGVHTFLAYDPDQAEIRSHISQFLDDHSVSIEDIEGIMLGKNGDKGGDVLYDQLSADYFRGKTLLFYKHLCGEYYTSGAFALWIASVILGKNHIPDVLKSGPVLHTSLNNILIYNQVNNAEHTLIYLKYDSL
jgi:3-oxoacyl-[acyl-carrier-protein] synthase II